MSYPQLVQEQLRLSILQLLSEARGGTTNSSLLETGLRALGTVVTRAEMHRELRWLEECALLTARWDGNKATIEINDAGDEVAQGIQVVPGIKRPRREDVR